MNVRQLALLVAALALLAALVEMWKWSSFWSTTQTPPNRTQATQPPSSSTPSNREGISGRGQRNAVPSATGHGAKDETISSAPFIRVVDRSSGEGLRAVVQFGNQAATTDSTGVAKAPSIRIPYRVSSPGYASRVVKNTSDLPFSGGAHLCQLTRSATLNCTAVYQDGTPAQNAQACISSASGDTRIAAADSGGTFRGLFAGDTIFAEDDVLTSASRRLSHDSEQIVIQERGIALVWGSDLRPGAVELTSICFGQHHTFSVSPDRSPRMMPRQPWSFRPHPPGVDCQLLDLDGFYRNYPTQYKENGRGVELQDFAYAQELRIVMRESSGPYVVVRDAITRGLLTGSFGCLVLTNDRSESPTFGDVIMIEHSKCQVESSKLWWTGRHESLRNRPDLRVELRIGCRGYQDLVVHRPRTSLTPGQSVFLKKAESRIRVHVRHHQDSNLGADRDVAGFASIVDQQTSNEVFLGMFHETIDFPDSGGDAFEISILGHVLPFSIATRANTQANPDIHEAEVVLPPLASISVEFPIDARSDLVLRTKQSILEPSESRDALGTRTITFRHVALGSYELGPRDRAEILHLHGVPLNPNVHVEASKPHQCAWDASWRTRSTQEISVSIPGERRPGESLSLWPYYQGSSFTIPSTLIRGRRFALDRSGRTQVAGASDTIQGFYVVDHRLGQPDRLLAFAPATSNTIEVTTKTLSVEKIPRGGAYVKPHGQVGPLERDGGIFGSAWLKLSTSDPALLRGVPVSCESVQFRMQVGTSNWEMRTVPIQPGTNRVTLVP